MKTISCTMIVRDEASTLEACLASIRPHVDELCILDTGSTDATSSIAARFADKFDTWTGCNGPEGRIADFSAARNRVLEMATGDALCWFDGDDVVRGGENLRKLASGAPEGAWAYLCPYEYERDAAGRVVTLQWRERLVYPRAGFEWRGPVHEGLLGKAGTAPAYIQTDLVTVQHEVAKSAKPRDPARNLRILEAHVRKVGEVDARNLHYLAAELMRNGRIGEACYWFRRHVQLSGWSDERALSLLHLARIPFAMGDYAAAADWALQAVATKSWPEPYWIAGQSYCAMAELGIDPEYNYRRGAHMLQQGFRADVPGQASLLMRDPQARYDAHAWLAPVLMRLGLVDEAIASAEAGLAGKPDHAELKTNVGNWKRGKVLAAVGELERLGAIPAHASEIVQRAFDGGFRLEPVKPPTVADIKADPLCPRDLSEESIRRLVAAYDGKLDIIFFLGHQLEAWTPRTLERDGMGGSETMAGEMSKRLAALGHRVRVYAHCDAEHPEGNYDGVEWFDEQAFLKPLSCDVLISSRRSDVANATHIQAAARVLWVHDVHVGEQFAPSEAVRFDLIWCLSNWHKEHFLKCYPWLNPNKVEVTRNGIDNARFSVRDIPRSPQRAIYSSSPDRALAAAVGIEVSRFAPGGAPRDAHRAIYSSSPDRGLAEAVAAWPAVRAAVPDAELHVYYGFENWERTLARIGDHPDPHCNREALNQLKLAIAKTKGVVLHGRVNQRELAQAMLGAGVWFYPTWFAETSCITAMEAQAAGLRCVCPSIAALGETVVDPWWSADPTVEVIEIMNGFGPGDRPGVTTRHAVDRFSLDTLATDWQTRLTRLVESQRANVVPVFQEAAQ